MKNKYDWAEMGIPEDEVIAGLPLTRDALKDHRKVGSAFLWDRTPQGQDFWAAYLEGRNQEEGKKFLMEMLDQLSA